jgi:chain length determinant protein EpsF
MTLHQLLSILRARLGVAALIVLSVVAVALAWVLLRPAHYVAHAAVLVAPGGPGSASAQETVSPAYLSTQIDIVNSSRVAQRAIELLPAGEEPMPGLRDEASGKPSPQQWMVQAIQSGLDVKPARESNVITISWTGRSPAEAARVANAFAQAYLDTNLSLRTAPARRDTAWYDQQVAQLRARVEKAQARLAAYQQQAGILSGGEQGDYERQRLAQLSAELAAAESREPAGAGAVRSPVVDNLRAEVARLDAQVQQASERMGPNHPKMQQMQAELGAMRARLASESARAGRETAGFGQGRANRIRELRRQVEAQKKRVLSMGRERGELSVLQHEAEAAQKDFDTVAAQAAQARLQGASTQGNAVLLAPAEEPLQASGLGAKPALVAALFGGLMLGVAGALLAELASRRVRCVEDLEAVARVPILGVVPAPPSRSSPLRLGSPRSRLAFHLPRSPA